MLTCFFCLLSALTSWATRCLSFSSKSLLSDLIRDSTGGGGSWEQDCGDLSTNEGPAVKDRKRKSHDAHYTIQFLKLYLNEWLQSSILEYYNKRKLYSKSNRWIKSSNNSKKQFLYSLEWGITSAVSGRCARLWSVCCLFGWVECRKSCPSWLWRLRDQRVSQVLTLYKPFNMQERNTEVSGWKKWSIIQKDHS